MTNERFDPKRSHARSRHRSAIARPSLAERSEPSFALESPQARGQGSKSWLERNVVEFGEGGGTVHTKGVGVVFEDNYLAFNGFASRAEFAVESWGRGDRFVRNTLLYNADEGVRERHSAAALRNHPPPTPCETTLCQRPVKQPSCHAAHSAAAM